MTGRFEYAIVRVEDRRRDERLNAGIVIFGAQSLDVRLPKRLDKLRALSSAFDLDSIRSDLESLRQIDFSGFSEPGDAVGGWTRAVAALTPFRLSSIGSFEALTAAAYEDWAGRLLNLLVDPEAAPAKLVKKRTKLSTAFKAALRIERVLARKGESLSAHRVVSNVQIAEGLAADFVLKNGAMHIIETVDASSDEATLRKVVSDIAVSALVLEQARMTFGASNTKARLVYDASSIMERIALPSLEAAAHQGAELVNWASHDDRRALIVQISKLADPLPTRKEIKINSLHASTQSKFSLN